VITHASDGAGLGRFPSSSGGTSRRRTVVTTCVRRLMKLVKKSTSGKDVTIVSRSLVPLCSAVSLRNNWTVPSLPRRKIIPISLSLSLSLYLSLSLAPCTSSGICAFTSTFMIVYDLLISFLGLLTSFALCSSLRYCPNV